MSVWNDKMTGHQAGNGQVYVNSGFNWSLLVSNACQFSSSNVWVLQHHCVHALDMSTIIIFLYLGFQYKWNQLCANNSCHTSGIQKGLHAGKWPDLMTWWPPNQTLQYTGMPLNRLHCNHTGWCYRPVVFQWQSRLNCIIGTPWKTTGATSTLGCHWNQTGWC